MKLQLSRSGLALPFLLMLMISVLHAGNAAASSCNGNGATKKIRFEKGAVCWTYRGKAVYFEGRFSRGQTVAVKMLSLINI